MTVKSPSYTPTAEERAASASAAADKTASIRDQAARDSEMLRRVYMRGAAMGQPTGML